MVYQLAQTPCGWNLFPYVKQGRRALAGPPTTRGDGGSWTYLVRNVKITQPSSRGLFAPIMGMSVEAPKGVDELGVWCVLSHMISTLSK